MRKRETDKMHDRQGENKRREERKKRIEGEQ